MEWHELATKCGATDGRIAWAGPDEFWTVSDGRPGQTSESKENINLPPLEDNTLCHFSDGQIVASYAHPAFQADSYLPMHAAGCFDPSDCWFAGEQLEEPQVGAFQLHWNGSALEAEPYPEEGHAIESMSLLEGILYEGVRISAGDRDTTPNPEPPVIHRVNPAGFVPVFEPETEVPLYRERRATRSARSAEPVERRRHALGRRRSQAGRRRHARAADGRASRRRILEPAGRARTPPGPALLRT